MLDDEQGIKKQHKPWELKKLSTLLYLTDSEENKIIPVVSQKGYTDLEKNVLQNSYYLFYRLKFYDDLDKQISFMHIFLFFTFFGN